MSVLDWTQGEAGIAYQLCPACRAIWYMRRDFCPACGNASPESKQAAGKGVVYAVTVVTRAPTEALRAYAPYTIVLVDCAEGFRVMAHGEAGLKIGDAVTATFIEFGGRNVPRFRAQS
ncbi:MAG: Zn-ribbon domain-containing OB-fold protein [Burkholderiales bacterium]